ncbi:hypothetical protein BDQ12DRAFT_686022 [Crucibulum laeve]|uniref:SNF2 family N-terminal domain-containing protein n=1 Tax=Crucibulum laeve TaxID=68775 RepID=A0A5C3LUN4_9AGAR|nr:hypothetical protein BDQ12DRAFT_686022 [Crucibulum laeve]
MSEHSLDPGLLFTPQGSEAAVDLPSKLVPETAKASRSPQRNFYVALPILPASQKKQYKPVTESSLAAEFQPRVNEVIGEYKEGNRLYYFACYDGGIAHKYPSTPFERRHKGLVEDYQRKKAKGLLKPFDPTATYVHPLSRVKIKINIKNRRGTVSVSSAHSGSSQQEVIPDSEEYTGSESSEEEETDTYSEGGTPVQTRRSGRGRSKPELPFSPKKTRLQRVMAINDSDSESDDVGLPVSRRPARSSRLRASFKVKLDADYSDRSEATDEYDEDGDYNSTRKSKSKQAPQKKRVTRVQPAYGHFRDISELGGDPYPEDADRVDLRVHRDICEKCHLGPAHHLLDALGMKSKKGRKRRRTSDDEFEEDEEEKYNALGGWVQCLKCPVSAHWRCLARTQQDEILRAAKARDRHGLEEGHNGDDDKSSKSAVARRSGLEIDQLTDFICGACTKGGICMGCMDCALEPDAYSTKSGASENNEDVKMLDGTEANESVDKSRYDPAHELLFRCFTCKRPAHYNHLPLPPDFDADTPIGDIAFYYQQTKSWLCADCSSYTYGLDKIIAWRPYPPNAIEPPRPPNEPPHYKDQLPREYLVKWKDRSFKRVQWVPHMWLVSTSAQKLKHFLKMGPKLELLQEPVELDNSLSTEFSAPTFEIGSESHALLSKTRDGTPANASPNDALPDAERRIPPSWKTVDRVLDVVLWYPKPKSTRRWAKGKKGKVKSKALRVESESESENDSLAKSMEAEKASIHEHGEQPSADFAGTVPEWEEHVGRKLLLTDVNQVAWAFIKWDDLGYDEATWDTPPLPEESGFEAFMTAFKRFVESRDVVVPKLSKAHAEKFDNRDKDGFRKHLLKEAADLDLGQDSSLKLMPFQVDGFNWLCDNWWRHQHCILADEMGLGKTVQIATFLGNIASKWNAFPALVVVPNSTITNWVREFERWAPKLRVVPFYGEKKARDVIEMYELFHKHSRPSDTRAKFHVLVTTYETVTKGSNFSLFRNQPRWEVLVIDEGQRLKSDSSLLFRKLNELNSIHRIIMTGTPLNNNMRELFNLMNFLDPVEWRDLEALEKEHEELNEELIKQLHNRLRPYFLRRVKSEVLQLPPKNEVIVPVSMAPLQKEVYRSILSHNANLLKGLAQASKTTGGVAKGRVNNVLMQLRKCLQHPYLFAEDIEPRGLPPQEIHEKLIDGSAKLRFLKTLLPKLKERGHRVLLFSQFVIALDVIEDFLQGEGYKYLRLDGNTKSSERQKSMDEFNRPGSDVFIYLLTTRAGGVGINLFTADTIIIFDPDFNPHQDLQAIARAYRYGQKKTCLVFKLMVKESAEERIMQIGKKKLVLDHLIVQKMDDDEDNGGENVQSILTYGAQALFEENDNAKDIIYSEQDIDKLIAKTEKEGDQEEAPKEGGLTFSFAKIWAADKDSLEEIEDDDQADSWAQTLQKIEAERAKELSHEVAISGRGARRKAADVAKTKLQVEETPEKGKGKSKRKVSKSIASDADGSAYLGSEVEAESDDSEIDNDGQMDKEFLMDLQNKDQRKSKSKIYPHSTVEDPSSGPVASIQNTPHHDLAFCGLCTGRHGSGLGQCPMTDRSENLAEFREMLLLHADDEPWEVRNAAITAIDNVLSRRGHTALIVGQPLHPIKAPSSYLSSAQPKKKAKKTDSAGPQSRHIASDGGPFRAYIFNESAVIPNTLSTRTGSSSVNPSLGQARALLAQSSSSSIPTKQFGLSTSVAGSSKRPFPPEQLAESSKKRAKVLPSLCPVCGGNPHQSLAKDCPLILAGLKSISKEIKRLDSEPGMRDTADILRKILSKKQREANAELLEIGDS